MARPLRVESDGAIYHVTSRGNAREDMFDEDGDRRVFLEILGMVVNRFNWLCHAYADGKIAYESTHQHNRRKGKNV